MSDEWRAPDLDASPVRVERRMHIGYPEALPGYTVGGVIIRCKGDTGVWQLLRRPGEVKGPWSVLVYWPGDDAQPPVRHNVEVVGWLEVGCDLSVDYSTQGRMVRLGVVSMLAIEHRR